MILQFSDLKSLLVYNIKYYRYKNNIFQKKLAEMCKLSPRYITDVERGLHCPTINKIEMIAKALDIEPYILFQNNIRDKDIVDKIDKSRQYNQN